MSNHFKNEKGNYGFILNSTDNVVLKDNVLDSINGSVLFNSNDNYLVNNTFIFRSYSSKLKIINSFNNDVYGNNLTVGIYLLNSGNNTFHSNWIYNKPKSTDMISSDYYLVDINCPNYFNIFYLNFILFDYNSDYKLHH